MNDFAHSRNIAPGNQPDLDSHLSAPSDLAPLVDAAEEAYYSANYSSSLAISRQALDLVSSADPNKIDSSTYERLLVTRILSLHTLNQSSAAFREIYALFLQHKEAPSTSPSLPTRAIVSAIHILTKSEEDLDKGQEILLGTLTPVDEHSSPETVIRHTYLLGALNQLSQEANKRRDRSIITSEASLANLQELKRTWQSKIEDEESSEVYLIILLEVYLSFDRSNNFSKVAELEDEVREQCRHMQERFSTDVENTLKILAPNTPLP